MSNKRLLTSEEGNKALADNLNKLPAHREEPTTVIAEAQDVKSYSIGKQEGAREERERIFKELEGKMNRVTGNLVKSHRFINEDEWQSYKKEKLGVVRKCARCGGIRTDDIDGDICGDCADDLRAEKEADNG